MLLYIYACIRIKLHWILHFMVEKMLIQSFLLQNLNEYQHFICRSYIYARILSSWTCCWIQIQIAAGWLLPDPPGTYLGNIRPIRHIVHSHYKLGTMSWYAKKVFKSIFLLIRVVLLIRVIFQPRDNFYESKSLL